MTLNSVRPIALALAATSTLLLAGCEVSHDKNGKKDNVSIGTPFGSMSVKTHTGTDGSNIGLAIYPGSTPVKEKGDNDSADVNLNFGNFHLGVKAASYKTSDSEEQVISFYRKDLSRYGDVIACRGKQTVGKPERTKEGLSCDENDHNHVSNSDHNDDLELRAGSPQHQHIVGIETKDGATHIGLVALTLPVGLKTHNESESE